MGERHQWANCHTDACGSDRCPCFTEGMQTVAQERTLQVLHLSAALGAIRDLAERHVLGYEVWDLADKALRPDRFEPNLSASDAPPLGRSDGGTT